MQNDICTFRSMEPTDGGLCPIKSWAVLVRVEEICPSAVCGHVTPNHSIIDTRIGNGYDV